MQPFSDAFARVEWLVRRKLLRVAAPSTAIVEVDASLELRSRAHLLRVATFSVLANAAPILSCVVFLRRSEPHVASAAAPASPAVSLLLLSLVLLSLCALWLRKCVGADPLPHHSPRRRGCFVRSHVLGMPRNASCGAHISRSTPHAGARSQRCRRTADAASSASCSSWRWPCRSCSAGCCSAGRRGGAHGKPPPPTPPWPAGGRWASLRPRRCLLQKRYAPLLFFPLGW